MPEERVRPGLAAAVGSAVRRGAPEGAQHEREDRGQILAGGGGEALVKPAEALRKRLLAAPGLGVTQAAQNLVQIREGDRGERRDQAFFLKSSARRALSRS